MSYEPQGYYPSREESIEIFRHLYWQKYLGMLTDEQEWFWLHYMRCCCSLEEE